LNLNGKIRMNRLNILIVTAIVMVIGTTFLGLQSVVAQWW
jgi:hypothetical protein